MTMHTNTFLMHALAVLLLGSYTLTSEGAIKCWTNNQGVRECGEKVPPEYAQKGYQELSKQGLVLDKQERAKTSEELEEEARQAALRAEEQRLQAERAREDQVLLATFSKVEDIELVRDERIAALESSIKLAQKRTETIQLDLDKRIQSAADAERAGKTPSDALLKDIESLRRQIRTNNNYIEERQKEQEQTRNEYAENIERFKILKSGR